MCRMGFAHPTAADTTEDTVAGSSSRLPRILLLVRLLRLLLLRLWRIWLLLIGLLILLRVL